MRLKLLLVLLLGIAIYFAWRYRVASEQLSLTESRALAAQGWLDFRDNPTAGGTRGAAVPVHRSKPHEPLEDTGGSS